MFGNKGNDQQIAIEALAQLDGALDAGTVEGHAVTARFAVPQPQTVGYGMAKLRLDICFGEQPVAQFALHDETMPRSLTTDWARVVIADAALNIRSGTYRVKFDGAAQNRMAYLTFGLGKIAGRVWAPDN